MAGAEPPDSCLPLAAAVADDVLSQADCARMSTLLAQLDDSGAGADNSAGFWLATERSTAVRPAKRQKQPCRDFKSDKGCSWGASCKYAHV